MRTGHPHLAIVLRIALIGALAAGCGDGDGNGTNALTRTTAEPPGAHCADGGVKLEVGVDGNDSGLLDDNEVNDASTAYVCNGSGKVSLIATSAEPAGARCPFGGTRIETGVDANGDGTLEASEILATATTFVCNNAPSGTGSPSTGIVAAVQPGGVSTSTTGPITVRFTLKDERGFPVDINGRYSQNLPILPRFALAYFTKDASTGIVSPLTTLTRSTSAAAPAGQPTSYNPLGAAPGHGTLTENGVNAGDYTYTFPTTPTPNGPMAVAYDATKLAETHVVWIQVARQTDLVFQLNANTFSAANLPYYFVPDGSNATPGPREIVAQAGCDGCHGKFKPETTTSALGVFHGGGRVAVGMCNVCHNPGRTTNPLADSASFIHRIHNGEQVADANRFHGIAVTYPQDLRKCDTCHGGAAQGAQAVTHPSALACKGCHDYVSFTADAPAVCAILGRVARDPESGKPLPCNHVAGPQPDTSCVTCHGPSGGFAATRYHQPVAPPDPANAWLVPVGGNANTNASFVAAAGFVPPGAAVITYDVKSVNTVADSVVPSILRPQITFKLKKDGADVVFPTYAPTASPPVTELMPGFVGSPSAYFAFAVPQDGKARPSDFNASASGYLKKIWDGSATGAGAGTLTGPDASGYYAVTLTGVQIAPAATLLTGGIGYTYSLASAPPLVQTTVADYPWIPNVPADGKAQGGLSVPAPNVWKVATGYTGRRAIVDNEKCKDCHGALGVSPSFHAGQRNDGPTCSFCHNPNRASAGWTAGSKYFLHAIHAGRKRVVPFTWHAAEAGPGFGEVEFPGTLNTCTTCHLPNTFDFTNPANLDAIAGMELTTVATGTYDTNPLTNSTYYRISPYVTPNVDYGAGFAYNAATNVTTEAAATTLVLSPITGACSACHDTPIAISHMTANGGQFYASRASVLAPSAPQEQCMICHGPGRVAAIGVVHPR